ncbi:MAG: putative RNA-binding Zn-ribbon protein involved in translation (DUF1610 family) [Colwellia sp.]|jgi:predicted RNA-binding Zn-ribbon protein involved in translation (DUF1610 family)
MSVSRGTCPECGSTNVTKERIMGSQTGDYICVACKFSSCPSRFNDSKPEKKDDN